MNRKVFSLFFVFVCSFAIAESMEDSMHASMANKFEEGKRFALKNGGYPRINGEMGLHLKTMEKINELKEHVDPNLKSMVLIHTPSNAKINQQNEKTYITIDLGKEIKIFNAQVKTKKGGHEKNKIMIKTKKPHKQSITVEITDKKLYVDHSKEENKTSNKNKERSSLFSSLCHTLDQKLDIEETEIEYDESNGILSVIIPKMKKPTKQIKLIEVTIKENKNKSKKSESVTIKNA